MKKIVTLLSALMVCSISAAYAGNDGAETSEEDVQKNRPTFKTHIFDCQIGLETPNTRNPPRRHGFNQNFLITTQMKNGHYSCRNEKDERFLLSFKGFGPGLGVSAWEGLKIVYEGFGSGAGNYYGIRLQGALLVGATGMTAIQFSPRSGRMGAIQVLGVDWLAIGIDPSLVRIKIEKDDRSQPEKK